MLVWGQHWEAGQWGLDLLPTGRGWGREQRTPGQPRPKQGPVLEHNTTWLAYLTRTDNLGSGSPAQRCQVSKAPPSPPRGAAHRIRGAVHHHWLARFGLARIPAQGHPVGGLQLATLGKVHRRTWQTLRSGARSSPPREPL